MGSCIRAAFQCSSFYVRCKKSGRNFVKLGRGRLEGNNSTACPKFQNSPLRRKNRFCSPLRRPRKIILTGDKRLIFSSHTRTWWNPFSRSGGTGFRCTLACQEFAATTPPPRPTTTVAPSPATNSTSAGRCGRKETLF